MKTELFAFKQKSQDFIVEEELPFELSGKGDAFFVFFEKRNLNTMDVVEHLCSSLGISRMSLGIAGLKDKKAITRQWISVYKSVFKKIGGENVFLNKLEEKVKIIKTNRHEAPIGMTTKIKNVFYIRLRANKNLAQNEKELASKKLRYLFNNGFPNFYGEQRFWIDGRNWRQWRDILEGKKSKINKNGEIIFKLQSYSSKMFNEYLISRVKKWLKTIDWDILNNQKTPTWPVFWYDLKLCADGTEAGQKERSFLAARKLNNKNIRVFEKYKIYWIRRALWVFPEAVNMKFQWDDLLVRFTLPSGTYASILIDEMLSKI